MEANKENFGVLLSNRLELCPVNVFGLNGVLKLVIVKKGSFIKDHRILENAWIQGENCDTANVRKTLDVDFLRDLHSLLSQLANFSARHTQVFRFDFSFLSAKP